MVLLAANPSFRAASCWSVLVMKGGAGERFLFFLVPVHHQGVAVPEERGVEGGLHAALEPGGDRPVLLLVEAFYLPLPLHHEPDGHGLHPPGAQAPANLLPEERTQVVAHEPVKDPPGLLGLHLLHVYLPRVLHGFPHRPGGNLVEGDPVDVLPVTLAGHLGGYVVGDGLSFPVGVRGQVDAVRVPGGPLQLGDDLFLAGNDAVFGGEVPVNVNAELLGGEVLHMAHGGLHRVLFPQDLVDGLRLCGRLDDDQCVLCH
jgi:hypothetical protein